jgi:hypothetical protein
MNGLAMKGLAGGLVALVAAAGIAVGGAGAWPTLGVCQYDAESNMTSCSFSNPDGIKSVFISMDTDDGIVVVVNETYDCETPVFVQYERLGPAHHYEVEACPPDPAVPDPEDPPLGSLPVPPEPPRIIGDLKLPPAPGAPHDVLITPRVQR